YDYDYDYDYDSTYTCNTMRNNRWVALDEHCEHPVGGACKRHGNHGIDQDGDQASDIDQSSHEVIIIRDSCDISVETTDPKVAASVQGALQVAIAVVINITIADSSRAEKVTQELLQMSQIRQANRQKLVIENSRDIDVTTTDTDVA